MKLRIALAIGSCLLASCVWGHPPYGHEQKHKHLVDSDPDVLGNAQNMLPLSYRERYNRPRFIGACSRISFPPTALKRCHGTSTCIAALIGRRTNRRSARNTTIQSLGN